MNQLNSPPQNSNSTTAIAQSQDGRLTSSYLFWLLFLMGFGGIHRIYNGKVFTGVLWFCTWGFFGIGQLVDLLLIPDMVDTRRMQLLRANGGIQPGTMGSQVVAAQTVQAPTREQLMVQILAAARSHQGRLTVPQAVLATHLGFDEVEGLLLEMHRKGYASMENDMDTGVIIYHFVGL